ncbi:MAG: hypothetical protein LC687_07505 [Actinobacteria bacterium]|nr:hypothetical protein [Actinomycetota bacterium]
MNISKLAPAEALEAITAMETVEQLREAADSINVKYSGNTGEATLRKNLMDTLKTKAEQEDTSTDDEPDVDLGGDEDEDEIIQVAAAPVKPKGPSLKELLEMDPNKVEDQGLRRQVVRAKAMKLHRVKITNLDPSDAQLNGAIVTVQNKYTGKVAKYVPFGDEEAPNGYHIPAIILNHLKGQKFAMRREIKGGAFGVKRYKTTMVNKFSIEELPMLTQKELDEMAAHQRASHAIDN